MAMADEPGITTSERYSFGFFISQANKIKAANITLSCPNSTPILKVIKAVKNSDSGNPKQVAG